MPPLMSGDTMKFTVDYEHIFFDKYILSGDEKKRDAENILKRVFKDTLVSSENGMIELTARDAEKEIEAKEKIEMLKYEFFLLLEPFYEEVHEEEPDIIEQAAKYIRQKYLYDTLCAQEVCERFNIERKALDKAFCERFSKTVSEYIKYTRVEKTIDLIKSGEKLEKVADLCGFGSLKTMQRSFKSVCGKTPGEYR